jgi:putative oxidoreductase
MNFFLYLTDFTDWGMLMVRLALGIIYFHHASQKIPLWKTGQSNQMPKNMLYLLRVVSLAETAGALGLVFGIFTQIAAAGIAAIMIGAIYLKITSWKKKFSGDGGWELDFALFSILFFIFIAGAGEISLDFMIWGL